MRFENAVFVWADNSLIEVVEHGSPRHARWAERGGVRFGGARCANPGFDPPGGVYGFLLAEMLAFAERPRARYEDVVDKMMVVDEFREVFRMAVCFESGESVGA